MINECSSDLLDLLLLVNGTMLHFTYEFTTQVMLWSYTYYICIILYDSNFFEKINVEILEMGLKTSTARGSPI